MGMNGDRPLGLISLDELVRVLPDLIADALRERDTRPPPASQATLTKATGVVTNAGTTTAEVQFDDDEPGVISEVQLSAAVSAGDRVVVLMSPGGSAIAIGNGNAQAFARGGPLITDSYYEFGDDGTTTGQAYTTEAENKWDLQSGFSNGSDVTTVSGRVTVQTTGVYSIAVTWDVGADTAADTYSYARGRLTLRRLNEPGSPAHDQVFLDDLKVPALNPSSNKHLAFFNCSIVAFMYAGDEVLVETIFTAGASPGSLWSYTNGSMYVERLA